MWSKTGQQGDACDADCQKGLHAAWHRRLRVLYPYDAKGDAMPWRFDVQVVVPEHFCTSGVAADAVLSLSMPPPLPGDAW